MCCHNKSNISIIFTHQNFEFPVITELLILKKTEIKSCAITSSQHFL